MRDKYEEAVDAVVFMVARLWFGEAGATFVQNQQLVRAALEQYGLVRVIQGLADTPGHAPPPNVR
jgi:uncharacterized protein YukE